jgi:hypothetical protein
MPRAAGDGRPDPRITLRRFIMSKASSPAVGAQRGADCRKDRNLMLFEEDRNLMLFEEDRACNRPIDVRTAALTASVRAWGALQN